MAGGINTSSQPGMSQGSQMGGMGKGQSQMGSQSHDDPYYTNPYSQPMINPMKSGGTNAYVGGAVSGAGPWMGSQSNTGLWYNQPNVSGMHGAKGDPSGGGGWMAGGPATPDPGIAAVLAAIAAQQDNSGSAESAGGSGSMGESDASNEAEGESSGDASGTY
jgi:hypothetical protein